MDLSDYFSQIDSVIHLGSGLCSEMDCYLAANLSNIRLVEADRDVTERLKSRYEHLPQVKVDNLLLATSNDKTTFYRYSLPDTNSTHKGDELLSLYPSLKLVSQDAQTATDITPWLLDALSQVSQPLLVVDLPGQEPEILAALSTTSLLDQVQQLIVYVNSETLYEAEVNPDETKAWLTEQGFELQHSSKDDSDRVCLVLQRHPLFSKVLQANEALLKSEQKRLTFENSITQKDQQIADMAQALEQLTKDNKKTVAAKDAKVKKLTQSVKDKEALVVKAAQELDALKAAHSKALATHDETLAAHAKVVSEKDAKAAQELEALKATHAKVLSSKEVEITKLIQSLKDKEALVVKAAQELEALKASHAKALATHDETLAAHAKVVSEKDAELATLTQSLKDKEALVAKAAQELEVLKVAHAKMLSEKDTKVATLTQSVKDKEASAAKAAQELETLKATHAKALATHDEALAAHAKMLSEKDAELATLTQSVKDKEVLEAKAVQELEALKEVNAKLLDETVRRNKEIIRELELKIEKTTDGISDKLDGMFSQNRLYIEQAANALGKHVTQSNEKVSNELKNFITCQQGLDKAVKVLSYQNKKLSSEFALFLTQKLAVENYDVIITLDSSLVAQFLAYQLYQNIIDHKKIEKSSETRYVDLSNEDLPQRILAFEKSQKSLKYLESHLRKNGTSAATRLELTPLVDCRYSDKDYLFYNVSKPLSYLADIYDKRNAKILVVFSNDQEPDSLMLEAIIPAFMRELSSHQVEFLVYPLSLEKVKDTKKHWKKLIQKRELECSFSENKKLGFISMTVAH